MGRGRKRLWIGLGIVAGLVATAAIALPMLLDVERYRDRIEAGLADATGWEVEIGDLDFSILRGMALTASPVTLVAPAEGGSRVRIDTLAVKARLLPLIHGQLDVERVVLGEPVLDIVRLDEAAGWLLPLPPEEDDDAPGVAGSEPRVKVEAIEIRDGTLRLRDAAGGTAKELSLEALRLVADLESGQVRGGARPGSEGGRLEWTGDLDDGFEVTLDGVAGDALGPWLGEGLIAPGAEISGAARIGFPLAVEADLQLAGLRLLEGERPFDSAKLQLGLVDDEGSLRLDRFRFDGDGVIVAGGGSIAPAVALRLSIGSTPLERVLAASRSVLPLPLAVEPPGAFSMDLTVDERDGELGVAAEGRLTAAQFDLGPDLPPAQDVEAVFRLAREGSVRIDLVGGRVAGGELRGTATIAGLDPPAPLVFRGGIQEAALGNLVSPWVEAGKGRLRGPTGLDAALQIDLSGGEIGPRSLQGRLDLRSRDAWLPGWDLERAVRRKIEEKLAGSDLGELARRELGRRIDGEAAAEKAGEVVEQVFDSFDASIDFDRWPWGLENLALRAGGFEATGAGTFDAETGALRLALATRLSADRSRELVAKYPDLKSLLDGEGRLDVPLELSGKLVAPAVSVDLGGLLERRLGGEDPKEAVKGLLKGLVDRERKKRSGDKDRP